MGVDARRCLIKESILSGKIYKNIDEGINFTETTLKHMKEPFRYVPMSILRDAILSTKGIPDPQGTKALMHYSKVFINGKYYKLEVLYDKFTNTILHFQYSK